MFGRLSKSSVSSSCLGPSDERKERRTCNDLPTTSFTIFRALDNSWQIENLNGRTVNRQSTGDAAELPELSAFQGTSRYGEYGVSRRKGCELV